MTQELVQLWFKSWRSIIEIILLSVGIYYGYLYFRGTRGAKVLTGLAIVFLTLTLISTLLNLVVIGWLLRSFSVFLAIALVVIFQPELRRGLAELGGHPIFSLTSEKGETVHDLAEAVTQLANKQFGALLAIQRDTLDRSLGLRHRAALGLTEESDAVTIVVSEETGGISICHRRRIERNFTPETFRQRLSEILLHGTYEETAPEELAREVDLPAARDMFPA